MASTPTGCECMASVHPLVGNCLRCGKVICQADGPIDACRFCASQGAQAPPSSTKRRGQQQRKFKHDHSSTYRTKVGGHGSIYGTPLPATSSTPLDPSAFPTLLLLQDPATAPSAVLHQKKERKEEGDLEKAIKLKQRLLEYDKTHARRTRLHDAAEDWQSSLEDSGLSPEERALALRAHQMKQQLVEEEQRKVRVTLDLHSGQFLQAEPPPVEIDDDDDDFPFKLETTRRESGGDVLPHQQKVHPALWMEQETLLNPPVYVDEQHSARQTTTETGVLKKKKKKKERVLQDDYHAVDSTFYGGSDAYGLIDDVA